MLLLSGRILIIIINNCSFTALFINQVRVFYNKNLKTISQEKEEENFLWMLQILRCVQVLLNNMLTADSGILVTRKIHKYAC